MDSVSTFVIAVTTSCSFLTPQLAPDSGGKLQSPRMSAQTPQQCIEMYVRGSRPARPEQLATSCKLPPDLKLGNTAVFQVPQIQVGQGASSKPVVVTPQPERHSVDIQYWGDAKENSKPESIVKEQHYKPTPSEPVAQVKNQEPPKKQPAQPMVEIPWASWATDLGKGIPADANCSGLYQLTSLFAGQTSITLKANQNFLAPVTITSPVKIHLSKMIKVAWNEVPNAVGYFVEARAHHTAGNNTTSVRWTSSATPNPPTLQGSIPLSRADLIRYLVNRTILAPDVRECTIPAGVFADFPSVSLTVIALGEDTIQKQDGVESRVVLRSIARMEMRSNVEPDEALDATPTQQEDGVEPIEEDMSDIIIPAG